MVQAVIWPRCSGGLVSWPEASSHPATTLPAGEPKVARTWAAPAPSHRARARPDRSPLARAVPTGAGSAAAEPHGRCACPRPAPGPRLARRGTSSGRTDGRQRSAGQECGCHATRIQAMARSVGRAQGVAVQPGSPREPRGPRRAGGYRGHRGHFLGRLPRRRRQLPRRRTTVAASTGHAAEASLRRCNAARSAATRPPQTPCWPIVQCRSASSRHAPRTGQARQIARVAAAAPAAARQRLVIAGNLVGAFSGPVLMIWCLAGCR